MTNKDAYKYEPFSDVATVINRNTNVTKSEKPFVLLLGCSGIGKSTLIKSMNEQTDHKFGYVTPYTTRQLRIGETDKIHISEAAFQAMSAEGMFIYEKTLYGNRYGTPIETVSEIQDRQQIPILDFPLTDVDKFTCLALSIIPVYIFPRTIMDWYNQIARLNRLSFCRLRTGLHELRAFQNLDQQPVQNLQFISHAVVNNPGGVNQAALELLTFLNKKGISTT